MLENHYWYPSSLRLWIHNIHRTQEKGLLDKFIFGKEFKLPWVDSSRVDDKEEAAETVEAEAAVEAEVVTVRAPKKLLKPAKKVTPTVPSAPHARPATALDPIDAVLRVGGSSVISPAERGNTRAPPDSPTWRSMPREGVAAAVELGLKQPTRLESHSTSQNAPPRRSSRHQAAATKPPVAPAVVSTMQVAQDTPKKTFIFNV